MNKLQKLFESNIPFQIKNSNVPKGIYWVLRYDYKEHDVADDRWMPCSHFNDAIEALWHAAKKHYPDAECFKEENNG